METRKTLSQLSYEDLENSPVWMAVGDYANDDDAFLEPAELDDEGRVPSGIEEVWCLCRATFSNGTEHLAAAMCRADSCDGPLLWTVWNGIEDIPLFVPPAPPPVIQKRGPRVFAERFGLDVLDVFPVTIEVVTKFEESPERRSVKVDVEGVIETAPEEPSERN